MHEFIVMLYKIVDPIRKTTDPENGPQLNEYNFSKVSSPIQNK